LTPPARLVTISHYGGIVPAIAGPTLALPPTLDAAPGAADRRPDETTLAHDLRFRTGE